MLRSKALKLSLAVGLVAVVSVSFGDIFREKESSPISGLYGGEATALTLGNFRVSAEIDHFLFCTPVSQSAGVEVLDGIVGLGIFATVDDLRTPPAAVDVEVDTRVSANIHRNDGVHLARIINLGVDEPLSTSSGFPTSTSFKILDLPSHENTVAANHNDAVTLQLIVTALSGPAETQTFNITLNLPSCSP